MEDSMQMSMGPAERGKEAQKYKKVRILGQGSMGRAYLVQCTQDSKLYVMKRINIGHLGPKQKQNALRQAQLHSLFTHPNIVQLKQLYQTTGQKICIVMQYAQGGDLEQFIQLQQNKLLSENTILTMFVQICLGVQEIHAKKIVHRDLKTANIFMNQDKVLKIGDFGISKTLDKTVMAATTMVGTPYYLSPEMVEGKNYSTKADIWALGVILYQLCTLKLPFEANSLPVLALKILKGSFPPVPHQFSKDLRGLILLMLQVDQKKRPTIQSILAKPFIAKYLSKEELAKQKARQDQKKQFIKEKEKKDQEKKVKAIDKEKEDKIKAKKQKEDKREEMRKQMREDLRKRRGQKEVQGQATSTKVLNPPSDNTNEVRKSPRKSPKKEVVKTPKPQLTKNYETKKEEVAKPWKNRKPGQKKDVTIQMFVPDLKPKKKEESPLPPSMDFKVEIYESKKSSQKASPLPSQEEKPYSRKSLPQIGHTQNYHYSQKNIKEPEIDEKDEGESSEAFSDQASEQNQIQQILDHVREVQELTRNLPDPSKSICLYEESQNFDSTVEVPTNKSRIGSMQLQGKVNSQSLEELRVILENRLGYQKLVLAYNVVKEHIDTYYNKLIAEKQEDGRQKLKKDFVFNKQLLRENLPFLTQAEFQNNIELFLSLIVYEDLVMHKNEGSESRYKDLY